MRKQKHFSQSYKTAAREVFDDLGKEIARELEEYLVPDEKIEQVVEFAIKLLCSNPKMKVPRIIRKTVEEFKLKKLEVEVGED